MAKQPSSREAEEEAIRKAKGKAIERKQKRRDNKKKPKEEAIETLDSSSIVNPGAKLSKNRMVMKSTWEEKLPPSSSPPSEVEVLKILKANVRGLPQPYELESAIVRDDDNLEVETRSFPENCKVALSAPNEKSMEKTRNSHVANYTSKPMAPGANIVDPLLTRVKVLESQRRQFNGPLKVRRRLTRVLMSYCVPLKEAMRTRGPASLMRTIRDAMIVYYEAYKLPEFGFIHGDISIENILVPIEGCVLTGGLTYKDRTGTLIDWNLCFNARGESSDRAFRSGTAAFMAPVLLKDKPIPRRTLAHDMESFFAVIIWVASLNYDDEAAFQAQPLAVTMLDRKTTPMGIIFAKESWFKDREGFREWITDYFVPLYRKDKGFRRCLTKLRKILYQARRKDDLDSDDSDDSDDDLDKNDNKVKEDIDSMKEGLFRQCMKEIDDYLGETKGCDEMEQIDRWRAAKGTDGKGARMERGG